MTKNTIDYLCKCNGWLIAITNIHWDALSMSQHKLCDDISDRVKSFHDKIAEIEQGFEGRLPLNKLKATEYTIKDLETLIKDIIDDTTSYYKNLEGDKCIGLRSECESFIGDMQQFNYLNDVCLHKGIESSEESSENDNIEEENKLKESIKRNAKEVFKEYFIKNANKILK